MSRSKYQENFIVEVMNRGFARAAHSFSKFMGKSVRISSTQVMLVNSGDSSLYASSKGTSLNVLVTHIIGELSGKSYLVLNGTECSTLYDILKIGDAPEELKEGVLLEIDNVISASVVSELSNALGTEIYGDVPALKKIESGDLFGYVDAENSTYDPSSVVYVTTTLSFDDNGNVKPKFIWKLSSKIFDLIPEPKVTAN